MLPQFLIRQPKINAEIKSSTAYPLTLVKIFGVVGSDVTTPLLDSTPAKQFQNSPRTGWSPPALFSVVPPGIISSRLQLGAFFSLLKVNFICNVPSNVKCGIHKFIMTEQVNFTCAGWPVSSWLVGRFLIHTMKCVK